MSDALFSIIFVIAQALSMLAFLLTIFLTGFGLLSLIFKKSAWYVQALLSGSLGLAIVLGALDLSVHFFGQYGYVSIAGFVALSIVITIKHKAQITSLLWKFWSSCLKNKLLVLITLVTSVSMWLGIALSGSMQQEGMLFQPGILHDSLWHLALIKSLLLSNPPVHPSDSTVLLSNYHYFYDLFLAGWHRFTGQSIILLYFTISSLFLTLFLAFSSLVLVKMLVKKNLTLFGSLVLIFLFWGGSLAFLIPLFLPGQVWGESSFWVSQTFVMLVNPQLLLSFALLNSFLVWGVIGVKKKYSAPQFLGLLSCLFALLYATAGSKFYAVIFAFVITVFFLGWYWIRNQHKLVIGVVIVMFLTLSASVISLRFVDFSAKQLLFSPIWFITSMIASPDRVYIQDWTLREQHYQAVRSWHHLLALKTLEAGIFYVGNLGLRVIGIFFFVPVLRNHKRKNSVLQNTSLLFLLFFLALLSSSIPLFFIQNGIVWNSIQFWYYTLFFMDFLAAITLGCLVISLKRQWIQVTVIITVLGFSSIMFFLYFVSQQQKKEYLSKSDIELAEKITSSDVLLVCPQVTNSSLYFDSSFFSAFTDAKLVLIDPVQLEILGQQGTARTSELKQLIANKNISDLQALSPRNPITLILCNEQDWKNQDLVDLTILHNSDNVFLYRINP